MKRFIEDNKKLFLGLVIGFIFSGVTVYAATQCLATDITFIPNNSEWNVSNVNEALNYLYIEENKEIFEKLDLNVTANGYAGDKLLGMSTSVDLDKGNYLIFGAMSYTSPQTTGTNFTQDSSEQISLTSTSGDCAFISGRVSISFPSKIYTTTLYLRAYTFTYIWKCELDSSATIEIADDNMGSEDNRLPGIVSIQAVKLD